jgi:hypothetical protein
MKPQPVVVLFKLRRSWSPKVVLLKTHINIYSGSVIHDDRPQQSPDSGSTSVVSDVKEE